MLPVTFTVQSIVVKVVDFVCLGPYLTVSDHLGYESSILPGTPLPGIAEEKKTHTANSSTAAAATAAASAAAAAATAATAPAFAYGSIDTVNFSGSSIEKDAAGLPFFDEQVCWTPQRS